AVGQSNASKAGPSRKRIWIALLVPAALLAAACILFFVFNSRRSVAEPNAFKQVQEPTPVSQAQVDSSPTPAAESQPLSPRIATPETANRASVPAIKATPSQASLPTPSPAVASPTAAQKVPDPIIKPPDSPTLPGRGESQPTPTAAPKP